MQKSSAVERFEFAAVLLVLCEVLLSGFVIILGRNWNGNQHGSSLDPRARTLALGSSIVLLLAATANIFVIVWRLIHAPNNVGDKHELLITAAAFAVLWYTGALCSGEKVHRRRRVAEYLASFPTFRLGTSGYNTPVSFSFRHAELVVRSATWSLHNEAQKRSTQGPHEYWRGTVARFCESAHARGGRGGAIVVLHDVTTQDEAGAELLTASFSHSQEPSKQLLANVIWKTVLRSGVWSLHEWEHEFASEIVTVLGSVRAVNGMRKGELWRNLPGIDCIRGCSAQGNGVKLSEAAVRELCTMLWAALAVEVFDHIGTGKDFTVLRTFVDIPCNIQSGDWTTATLLQACTSFAESRI